MATDPKFIAAQEAYNRAIALKIQIDRGSYGTLKQRITQFFEQNPIFLQYAPTEPWLGATSSESYTDALNRLENAIKGIDGTSIRALSDAVSALHDRAEALSVSTESKAEIKAAAVAYLKTKGIEPSGWRSLTGRENNIPSSELVEKLGAVVPASPDTQVHIDKIQPFTQKTVLKEQIISLFDSPDYKACFGQSGNEGLRRYLRTSHAPLLKLRDVLEKSATGLSKIDSEEKRQSQLKKIADFKDELIVRLDMKASLTNYEKRAESLTQDFSGNFKKISAFASQLGAQVTDLNESIVKKRNRISTIDSMIATHQSELDKLLKKQDQQLQDYENGPSESLNLPQTEIDNHRISISGYEAEKDALIRDIDGLELNISGIMQVLGFCDDKKTEINEYKTQLDECHEKYKQARVLVLYFKLGDKVGDILNKLAKELLCDGCSSVDAIGSINVVLLFEAGIRAGYDLGIAALTSKVGMTVALSGTLAILESREVMFSHRLALYLCMEAKAQVGTPSEVSDQLEQLSIPAPPDLLNASVQASCNLVDRHACHVYLSEQHWSAQWSHEITRRIVFLNRYQPGTNITPEWLETQIASMSTAVGNAATDVTSQERIKAAIDADKATIALLRQPYKQLHFRPNTRVKWSGGLEIAGYDIASHSTSLNASFTFDRSQKAQNGGREEVVNLGSLEESISLYTAEATQGQAIYHKFVPPGTTAVNMERHYLEVIQRETNIVKGDDVQVDWVASMPNPPRKPEALYRLSNAVNFTAQLTYPVDSKRVVLPPESFMIGPVSDQANFMTEVALRLELIKSGGENSLIERLLALPEKIGDAGDKLGQANQVLGSTVIQSISDQATAFSEDAQPLTEALTIGKSTSTYVRYIDQPRYSLDLKGVLTKSPERVWTPQVFRGYSLGMVNFKFEAPDVPIIPGLSFYSGFRLKCNREVSQYELLGTDTFTYLKTVYKRMIRVSPSGTGTSGDSPIDQYIDLHWPEIADLLKNVTLISSGAFSEIAEDYASTSIVLREASRKLGDSCFNNFCPGLPNPFEDKTLMARSRWAWLAEVMSSHAALNRSLHQAMTQESLQSMTYELKGYPANWKEIWEDYSQTDRTRTQRICTFKEKFNNSVTRKIPHEDQKNQQRDAWLNLILKGMDNSKSELTQEVDRLSPIEAQTTLIQQIEYGRALKTLYETSLKGPGAPQVPGSSVHPQTPLYLMAIAQRFSLNFNESAYAELREAKLRPSGNVLGGAGNSLQTTDKEESSIWCQWKQDHDHYWNLFVGSFFAFQGGFGPTGAVLLKDSLVPTETSWESERGLVARGFFQKTSDETRVLKQALANYRMAKARVLLPRVDIKEPEATFSAIKKYLDDRLLLINQCLKEIQKWKMGKDEEESKRMPNVVMLVEVPALDEKKILLRMSGENVLRWHIRSQLVALCDLDAIAAYSTPAYVKPIIPSDLKILLKDYLAKSEDVFEHHPLLHGGKQLTLPDDAPEVQDATEEVT